MRRILSAAILFLYAVFILSICLVYFRKPGPPVVSLRPFRSILIDLRAGGYGLIVNFIGNVVAFLPFGGLLPTVFHRARSPLVTILICGAFSLMIEVGQFAVGGRVSDVDDLTLNTLGGALGWGGWWLIRWSSETTGNLFEHERAASGVIPGPPRD